MLKRRADHKNGLMDKIHDPEAARKYGPGPMRLPFGYSERWFFFPQEINTANLALAGHTDQELACR